jgi:chromosome segregation ATPase
VEKIIAELRAVAEQLREFGQLRDQLANVRAEVESLSEKLTLLKREFAEKSAEKEAGLKRLDAAILDHNRQLNALRGEIMSKTAERNVLTARLKQGVPS